MILTSTVVMYGLMYLNTYELDHVAWIQTRAWMALLMGGVMAVIMMGFMWAMYDKKGRNWGIMASLIGLFLILNVALGELLRFPAAGRAALIRVRPTRALVGLNEALFRRRGELQTSMLADREREGGLVERWWWRW